MPITINGSGTLTGISAGGLPDAIITQPELAANVAGNGPAFSAYVNGNKTISNATFFKVPCDTEEFDTNSNYDAVTNYRFTPTVAGYYKVSALASGSGSAVGFFGTFIYKNGSRFKDGANTSNSASDGIRSVCSSLIYMNGSTDYIEFYLYQSSGGNMTLNGAAAFSFFQAAMVRAA